MSDQNVDMKIDGTTLVIRVDLTKNIGPSKSGKTLLIASTKSGASIGGMTVGLNVYKKAGT
jgi:hypothetical protein